MPGVVKGDGLKGRCDVANARLSAAGSAKEYDTALSADWVRKDAMVWNYFVIYGPYGYKWLAKGWRMVLVYALSKKEFNYLESSFCGANGMYSTRRRSNQSKRAKCAGA